MKMLESSGLNPSQFSGTPLRACIMCFSIHVSQTPHHQIDQEYPQTIYWFTISDNYLENYPHPIIFIVRPVLP